ncbi:c-type cytochrome [Pseudoprimorskyibacter insulae]|uniref:Cytochrome c-556 n=1 Tax=Pseudoprimorskyibacter insulae TaxID=1695997 RepID=A0A2R8AU71_9RHOB|nr:cytochrome c [Pseudoprimorskyibacter insulae]SPF79601.1 Cytochrome c-556 [Pseudoprimorskyibacter insulae]
MRLITTTLVIAALATTAFAHGGVRNAAVKARMDVMVTIKDATGVLGNMAKGSTPYDAAQAAAAKAALIAAGAQVVPLFEAQEKDPKSEALPVIWKQWDDFAVKSANMVKAAEQIDTASLDGIRGTLGPLAKSCRQCHAKYRIEK